MQSDRKIYWDHIAHCIENKKIAVKMQRRPVQRYLRLGFIEAEPAIEIIV